MHALHFGGGSGDPWNLHAYRLSDWRATFGMFREHARKFKLDAFAFKVVRLTHQCPSGVAHEKLKPGTGWGR